jgi:hypothetical protein
MSSNYSIGAMNQLSDALESAGFTPDDVTKLKQFGNLKGIKDILLGHAEIKAVEHLIDCDADPFVPNGWRVEKHRKGGQIIFDLTKIELYLSKNQQNGKVINGSKLRKELENKPILNANILDYLLANPHLIPENWKKDENGNTRYIFFWGTIYRGSDGYLCVRGLFWRGGGWRWRWDWLSRDWDDLRPAALLAS